MPYLLLMSCIKNRRFGWVTNGTNVWSETTKHGLTCDTTLHVPWISWCSNEMVQPLNLSLHWSKSTFYILIGISVIERPYLMTSLISICFKRFFQAFQLEMSEIHSFQVKCKLKCKYLILLFNWHFRWNTGNAWISLISSCEMSENERPLPNMVILWFVLFIYLFIFTAE